MASHNTAQRRQRKTGTVLHWLFLALSYITLSSFLSASAFVIIPPRKSFRRLESIVTTSTAATATSLHVSIGLGPSEEAAVVDDEPVVGPDFSLWQEGIDYERPDHEAHRTDRMTAMDRQCDAWFSRLLLLNNDDSDDENVDDSTESVSLSDSARLMAGPIATAVRHQLCTVRPVVRPDDTEPVDTSSPEWTPYVTTPLPWNIQSPSYGLEQYGLPIPRRNAEAWRQFDVVGMVSIPMDGSLRPRNTIMDNSDTNADDNDIAIHPGRSDTSTPHHHYQRLQDALERAGGWLADADCEARLIYINGHFCPALSHESATARNVASLTDVITDASNHTAWTDWLARVPDGYTDALVTPVPMQNNAPSLTSHRQLSEPNHNMGDPTTQFAVNTQQGMACFAALNTLHCTNMAYVHSSTPASIGGSDDTDVAAAAAATEGTKPILIVHATTSNGGVPVEPQSVDRDEETTAGSHLPMGVVIHPRTVIVAEPHTHVSVVQQSVSLDTLDERVAEGTASRPILRNGYTQVWIKANANVSHTVIEESGGLPVRGTEERSDDTNGISSVPSPRDLEAQRPALRNTILETHDVHCAGADASYTGTVLSMGGNGRTRLVTSVSLLEPTARCKLSGFTLAGGTCRAETKTCLHHIADHCTSEQLQKTMVAGRAVASFRGRIRVEQSAQQTNSQQMSRTIVLSDKCRAWTVPSLEIVADDVQCTHGATVSDLSEEELFYLRSRGLTVRAARNLLMYAFCNDVVEHVPPSVLGSVDGPTKASAGGLQQRILQRLENLVPTGQRALKGEYQSV